MNLPTLPSWRPREVCSTPMRFRFCLLGSSYSFAVRFGMDHDDFNSDVPQFVKTRHCLLAGVSCFCRGAGVGNRSSRLSRLVDRRYVGNPLQLTLRCSFQKCPRHTTRGRILRWRSAPSPSGVAHFRQNVPMVTPHRTYLSHQCMV